MRLSDSLLYANEFLSSMLTSADWMLKTAKSSNIQVEKVENYYWIIDLLKKNSNLSYKKI